MTRKCAKQQFIKFDGSSLYVLASGTCAIVLPPGNSYLKIGPNSLAVIKMRNKGGRVLAGDIKIFRGPKETLQQLFNSVW